MTPIRQFLLPVLITCCIACNDDGKVTDPKVTAKDGHPTAQPSSSTSIQTKERTSDLSLDSAAVAAYATASGLDVTARQDFFQLYADRNFQYAWFDSKGIFEHAANFLNLYRNYNDLFHARLPSDPRFDSLIVRFSEAKSIDTSKPVVRSTELALTERFIRFARYAYAGRSDIDTKDLGWFIPRKKVSHTSMLDSLLGHGVTDATGYEPHDPRYQHLKAALGQLQQVERNGGWPIIGKVDKRLFKGDSSALLKQVKQRLWMDGDLIRSDTSSRFDDSLAVGLYRFQRRHGLKADSSMNAEVAKAMNVPVKDRIDQVIINLERLRWIPDLLPAHYIIVNIPEFRFHLYDSGKHQWSAGVIVGSTAHNTVIFTGQMQYIVFSPYWNVPYSIVKNEMGRSASYFSKRNMEVTGHYSDGLPIVRQRPGPNNSLGRVKFLFPNSHSIYIHDTPGKDLFNQDVRAFSHGCIRMSEPVKLAKHLLKDRPEWTADSIAKAMNRDSELSVTLRQPVPVFIGYFTSWVDDEGRLNFREDIYGHDKKMAERIFIK